MSSSSEDEGLDDLEFEGASDAENEIDEDILDALEEDLAAEASEAEEVQFVHWLKAIVCRLMPRVCWPRRIQTQTTPMRGQMMMTMGTTTTSLVPHFYQSQLLFLLSHSPPTHP